MDQIIPKIQNIIMNTTKTVSNLCTFPSNEPQVEFVTFDETNVEFPDNKLL